MSDDEEPADRPLSDQLRDLAQYFDDGGDSRSAKLIRQGAYELDRLERIVAGYRWKQLAEGLLVCYLQYERVDAHNTTRRTVVHRDDCKRAPENGQQSGLDLIWNVRKADGHTLPYTLNEAKAQLCKICKPNVDPETVID